MPVIADMVADSTTRVIDCRADYVRYKPGTRCYLRLIARLDTPTGPYELPGSLTLLPEDQAAAIARRPSTARLAARGSRRHPVMDRLMAELGGLGGLLQLWPMDRGIRGLARAAYRKPVRRSLGLRLREPEMVRYKPARKALLRYAVKAPRSNDHADLGDSWPGGNPLQRDGWMERDEPRDDREAGHPHGQMPTEWPAALAPSAYYGKVLPRKRARALIDRFALLATVYPSAPRVAATDPQMGLILHPELAGSAMRELTGSRRAAAACSAGAELGRLHAMSAGAQDGSMDPARRLPDVGVGLAELERSADYLETVVPRLNGRARRLARRIASRLMAVRHQGRLQYGLIHGDFYADQVLVAESDVTLIDFDELAWGHPWIDVGNFLAHEVRSGHGNAAAVSGAFLAGYGADQEAVQPFVAAGLLRLAIGPFRRLETDWEVKVVEGVRDAELALSNGLDRPPALTRQFSRRAEPEHQPLDVLELDEALADVFGDAAPMVAARLVREKPGRRAVVRYEAPGRDPVYAKLFARPRGRKVAANHDVVEAGLGDRLAVPRVLARGPRHVLLSRVAGEPILERVLAGDQCLAAAVAEALRRLHASDLPLLRQHTLAAELSALERWLDRLVRDSPHLSNRVAAVGESLRGRLSGVPWRFRPLHRDFYHDQVLVEGQRVGFIDFDDAKMGEPLVDVANFSGHLVLAGLQRPDRASAAARAREAFLSGYAAMAGEPTSDPASPVRLFEAATLLRLAGIHRSRPSGDLLADALVGAAEDRLRTAA